MSAMILRGHTEVRKGVDGLAERRVGSRSGSARARTARRVRWPVAVALLALPFLTAEPGIATGGGPLQGAETAETAEAPNGNSAHGTFTRHATTGPRPSERSTPAVAAVGGSIYLFGGVMDDFRTNINTFYDDLYRFDPATDTWTELAPTGPVPPARAFAAAASHEASGRMFVHGGATYGPFFAGFVAFDDLWAYDVATGTWTEMPAGATRPAGRSRPNMWTVGDQLYVFGGVTATFETLNDLWVYDLTTETWTEVIPNGQAGSPPSRHEAQAGTIPVDGRLTVYGGEAVDLVGGAFFDLLPDTWELDLATLTWTDVTPPPDRDIQPPRNYGSAVVVGESLYLHGGDIPGGSSGCGAPFEQNPVDEVWHLDVLDRTWQLMNPTGDRAALKRTAAAAVDGRMYVFSGFDFECEEIDDPGQVWNLDVFSYEPGKGSKPSST